MVPAWISVPGVAGVFLRLLGFPGWQIFLICALGFLGLGGFKASKFFVVNLYRDLWIMMSFAIVFRKGNPMIHKNLSVSDIFQETAKKRPNKVAIIFEDRKLTYKEIDETSNKIANLLRSTTPLQHRDVVAVVMENSPELVEVCLALCKIGVTCAFINHNLRGESLAHCIRAANCSGVIFDAGFSEGVAEVLPELEIGEQVMFVVGGSGTSCSVPGAKCLEEEIKSASAESLPSVPDKSTTDHLSYVFSSGTTGLPKACRVNHRRTILPAFFITNFCQVSSEDVVYVTLPLYHTTAFSMGLSQMIFNGCTMVLRRKFSASNFWKDCIEHKCTVFFYIGELCRYILLAEQDKPFTQKHSIRLMIGNGMKARTWEEFQRRFSIPRVIECYGATEGNFGMTNPFNKVGACGRVMLYFPFLNPVRLAKVDPKTGELVRNSEGFCVPPGVNEPGEAVGEIKQNKPSSHFIGYTDKAASKKKVMEDVFVKGDRYFMSGDILRQDEEGFWYFCDRTGDTFRWKGENVSTLEVEDRISSALKLRDVVVYGVEVPGCEGKAGMAAIKSTLHDSDASGLTEDDITTGGLAETLFKVLPVYAVPRFLRLVPAVEMTGTFKLKKVQLRQEGFDLTLPDPIFVLDMSRKAYQPLTEELYQQLQNGTLKV